MNPVIEIESAGPSVTIQDVGRPGYARFGLSAGGVMDTWAMAEGEALLGNPPRSALLEMAGYGGQFRVRNHPCWCALTGAPMQTTVDGTNIPWRSSFYLEPDQLLEIGSVLTGEDNSGTYGYLHVAGGFDTPEEIDSRSTHLRAGIGGLDGKPLSVGAKLTVNPHTDETSPRILPEPAYLTQKTIRIVWGPHAERFSEHTRDRLLAEIFTLSHRRDRMAMRLDLADKEPFESLLTGLSDPAMAGDIQVTGDGAPAILMCEHQPTGGYPRIATVISADLAAAAQLSTGVPFQFELVTVDEAVEALHSWHQALQSLDRQTQPLTRSGDDLLAYNLISGAVSADET